MLLWTVLTLRVLVPEQEACCSVGLGCELITGNS